MSPRRSVFRETRRTGRPSPPSFEPPVQEDRANPSAEKGDGLRAHAESERERQEYQPPAGHEKVLQVLAPSPRAKQRGRVERIFGHEHRAVRDGWQHDG